MQQYIKDKMEKIRANVTASLCILFICAVFVLHLMISAYFPITPDEAYYWIWSHSLQFGYPDHPPMIAYWIRGGVALFGDNRFGIRFFTVLAGSLTVFLIWRICINFFGKSAGIWGVLLFSCTIFFSFIALIATPDTAAVFFISLGLWAISSIFKDYAEGIRRFLWIKWSVAGIFFGGAFMSKYTAILPIFGIFSALLYQRPGFFCRREFLPGLTLFFLMIIPNIFWNFNHDGGAFIKQAHRLTLGEGHIAAHYAELFAGQMALLTPFIFICVFLGVKELKNDSKILAYSLLPGLAFFLIYPLHARVQANWPFILFPIAIIIASQAPLIWKKSACMMGGFFTLAVYGQVLFHIFPFNAHDDPALRQSAGWSEFAQNLRDQIPGDIVLESPDYALGSILSYYLRDELRVGTMDPRIQSLAQTEIMVRKVREIKEIRGKSSDQALKICRFYMRYGHHKRVRCYEIGTEQVKKIPLFSVK